MKNLLTPFAKYIFKGNGIPAQTGFQNGRIEC